MERLNKTVSISQAIDQSQPNLNKTQVLDSFDILTDEEKYLALKAAALKKEALLREIEWKKKISRPQEVTKISSEKYVEYILNEGKKLIPKTETHQGFALSDEELDVYKLLCYYFNGDPRFEENGMSLNKGIILFGKIGCGKTTALKLFSNNPFSSFLVVPCRQIGYEFSKTKKGGYEAIEKYFHNIRSSNPGLTFGQKELGICFDDLGTESTARHFGNESNVMAEIILNRYDNESEGGFKTHITTNLSSDEIEEFYGSRVRSRMREMFNPIEYPNVPDKRK